MTDEQKIRRAELARENGRKSRGPISPLGKYASSMNAIATGKHVKVHKEIFPECDTLYSTDERESFVRLHLKHLRQYRPQAECEHAIVRQMTTELFDYQRASEVETLAVQRNLDSVLREHPDVSPAEQLLQGFHRAASSEDKTHRFIERKKKGHLSAYNSLQRNLIQLRKNFPMQPPEPIDISADSKMIEPMVPCQEAVEEMLRMADQAKNEPEFELPAYVLNLLENDEVMEIVAPNYECEELLARFGRRKVPKAA